MIETAKPPASIEPGAAGQQKERHLRRMMREMESVLVAYSGGVDSSYLAAIATSELKSKAVCVTGISPSVSAYQLEHSKKLALDLGFNLRQVATNEMDSTDYRKNGADRCYFCKDDLYGRLEVLSSETGSRFVIDGTNADDIHDIRPGRKAAAEHGVRSPLAELGFAKKEIRELSRRMGLPTWDMPASPCLSSRIARNVPVTIERLTRVERAEDLLRSLRFREFRVRLHGDLARIEVTKDELTRLVEPDLAAKVAASFKEFGFKFITIDLEGFRSGSMNEIKKAALE